MIFVEAIYFLIHLIIIKFVQILNMRLILFFLFIFCSCSTKKDILLIQDSELNKNYNYEFKDITIQPDDILRIKISSKTANLTSLFASNQIVQQGTNLLGYQIEGFLVNSKGYINLPLLEPFSVKELTLDEASIKIQKLLENEDIIKNASVDVKILNAYFTILGEVKSPGRYSFLENNMDIFQALGIAGDLTINGKRNDIRIISKNSDEIEIRSINLTSTKLLETNSFQIFPGDVIIVNANNARVKNAGVIGNFGNLLSVLSLILSSVILISN